MPGIILSILQSPAILDLIISIMNCSYLILVFWFRYEFAGFLNGSDSALFRAEVSPTSNERRRDSDIR